MEIYKIRKFLSKAQAEGGQAQYTMARKRRKDEHRNGAEGTAGAKGRLDDTNIEVLPARSQAVDKTKSSQVPLRNVFQRTALTRLGSNRRQETYWKEEKTLG